MELCKYVPHNGIMFCDISPLLAHENAFLDSILALEKKVRRLHFDAIVGLDARGFIFGATLAYQTAVGFIQMRKAGKLPGEVISTDYKTEYSKDVLELQVGAVKGKRVLIVDDVLATGGTMRAAIDLVRRGGGEPVGFACFLAVEALKEGWGEGEEGAVPIYSLYMQ